MFLFACVCIAYRKHCLLVLRCFLFTISCIAQMLIDCVVTAADLNMPYTGGGWRKNYWNSFYFDFDLISIFAILWNIHEAKVSWSLSFNLGFHTVAWRYFEFHVTAGHKSKRDVAFWNNRTLRGKLQRMTSKECCRSRRHKQGGGGLMKPRFHSLIKNSQ